VVAVDAAGEQPEGDLINLDPAQPASRSICPARSATTRVRMSDTLRQTIRSKTATTESVARHTS
jgi:hypothetical protein